MLYVSTRNNRDAFTPNRAIRQDRCPDGGHYLPFRHPVYTAEEMDALLQKSPSACIADVLNRLFGTKLTGWDVEFSIGRHALRAEPLQHRIFLGECWHTPGYRFDRILRSLSARITEDSTSPSGWVEIAVRAAVLFGIFAELRRQGIEKADISCLSGNFIQPISAWYARHWGLPIGTIVCCCNENNNLWDLICNGQMRTDTISTPTILSAADIALPEHLERLIYECGGITETQAYLEACRKGRLYCPPDIVHERLRSEIAVSVVSSQRIGTTIRGMYATHGKLLSRAAALACAGLLDHRTRTASARAALVWSEDSPAAEAEQVSEILGIPARTIHDTI